MKIMKLEERRKLKIKKHEFTKKTASKKLALVVHQSIPPFY